MIAAVLLQASAPAPVPAPRASSPLATVTLAPPLDRPLRYRLEQTRIAGDRIRHFAIERRVVFRRDAAGALAAEVTLVPIAPAPAAGVARRFAAGAGALGGRTLVFHIDATGQVTAVDDADAVWQATVEGVAAAAAARPQAVATVDDPAAALRALPPPRRLSMIASAITPLFATRDAASPPSTRAVTIASAAMGGAAVPLAGTRTVTRPASDRVEVAITAQGDGATPIRLERHRVVDAATGLLIEETETVDMTVAGATQRTESRTTLVPW